MQISYIETEGLSIAIREAGPVEAPAFLLLHGWPQSSYAFEQVIGRLARDHHVVAPDLPAIGDSQGVPRASDKRTLARLMRGVAEACGLRQLVAAGHDIGGQIVFALLRDHPEILSGAAIMDVAIPGVAPWENVIRNPQIWHFAFHAVPALPETLVSGHQHAYFDFFFNVLSKQRASISTEARDVYAKAYFRPESLQAGFDWYRAFPEDAKANAVAPAKPIAVPVLYLRGSAEPGDIGEYVDGLRAAGLANVEGDIIADSGHFVADENPEALAMRLARFHRQISPPG
ncbi:alpha/beta hydrolase [Mesorhizobium sp. M0152]|uniref:alpha/beta fold hydrolase n=1 Tax=Mesorhizobium sp. M0152 TaxID=2956898 RepID=UPI003335ADCE